MRIICASAVAAPDPTRSARRRRILAAMNILLALLLSLVPTPAAPPPAPPPTPAAPGSYGRANASTLHAYVVLLRLRYDLYARWKATGKFPDDAEANAALKGHSEYWDAQLKRGRALVAGAMGGDYWDNAALIVFEAGSQAEADAVVADDPAVKAFAFQAQVRPFDVFFLSNKYSVRAP